MGGLQPKFLPNRTRACEVRAGPGRLWGEMGLLCLGGVLESALGFARSLENIPRSETLLGGSFLSQRTPDVL